MSITALIVDDSVDARNWLRRKLEGMGIVIAAEVENATDGLKRFQTMSPQLVTLDIMMPEIDGMDAMALFQQIRQDAPDTAILVVSARPQSERRDFLKGGAIGYLEKPFVDFEAVARILRAYFPELAIRRARA